MSHIEFELQAWDSRQKQGWIQEFLKGGLYTTEVTLNTNGVEGEWWPLPLARSLDGVQSHTPPPNGKSEITS